MQVISLEDCRRVFIATMKFIYRNDTEANHTYQTVRNYKRTNLPDNSGDVVVVPTRKFKEALRRVVKQLGLHPEQTNAYLRAFGDLAWILRPETKDHKYKKSLSDSRCFHGQKPNKNVFLIDRIKFDLLCSMNGQTLKGDSNQTLLVPLRNPDGDVITDNDGRVQMTSVTYGLVQDLRYKAVSRFLDEKIKEKDKNG